MTVRPDHMRYLKRFLPAATGYFALLELYVWLVPRTHSLALRIVLAVLPMLPVLLVMRALMLMIREQDELERLLALQALAAAAVLCSCGFFSFGLLIGAGAVGSVPAAVVALVVFPCFFIVFGLALLVLMARLRGR